MEAFNANQHHSKAPKSTRRKSSKVKTQDGLPEVKGEQFDDSSDLADFVELPAHRPGKANIM